MAAKVVKDLVIEDGLFPAGGLPLTNELIDVAATKWIVGTHGWPTAIAWVDGFTGIDTKVGGSLCASVPAKNPMRIVYENLLNCGPPGDGRLGRAHDVVRGGGRSGDLFGVGPGWCGSHQ